MRVKFAVAAAPVVLVVPDEVIYDHLAAKDKTDAAAVAAGRL
jgi:hypothetical protein